MHRWLALSLVLLACGSDDGDGLSGPMAGQSGAGGATAGTGTGGSAGATVACAPGQSVACVGPGACQGGQVCNADGSGYGPCDCGPVGGAGGASAGAGGQPEAGKGGGACVPLTAQKACAANQCGQASDGCGGLVECSACEPWLKCELQPSGQSLCAGNCKPFDANELPPETRSKCLAKTEGKVQPQECSYSEADKPDGCLITKNPGLGGNVLCCPPAP